MLLHSLVNLLGAQCQCWIRHLKLWGHPRQLLLVESLRGLLLLEIHILSHHGDILMHFECYWIKLFLFLLIDTNFFAILGLIWLILALLLRLNFLVDMLHGSNWVHSSRLAHLHEVFGVHRIIVELLLLLLQLHLLIEVCCEIRRSTSSLIIHLIHGLIWKLGLHGRGEGLHGGGRIRVSLVLANTPIDSVVVKHVLAESLVG